MFKSIDGIEIGDIDEETKKYDKSKIKNAKDWTYEKYNELDDEQKDKLDAWLMSHPEVLKECDETLQVAINIPFNDTSYIDSLIDYVGPYIKEKEIKKVKESYFMNFDQFVFESEGSKEEYEMSEDDKKKFDDEFDKLEPDDMNKDDLLKLMFGDEYDDPDDIKKDSESKVKLDYLIGKCEKVAEFPDSILNDLKNIRNGLDSEGTKNSKYYITFGDLNDNQIDDLKELYENEEVSIVALKVIGEKVLNDKTFSKNSKLIVETINKCIESKREKISLMTYSVSSLDSAMNLFRLPIDIALILSSLRHLFTSFRSSFLVIFVLVFFILSTINSFISFFFHLDLCDFSLSSLV